MLIWRTLFCTKWKNLVEKRLINLGRRRFNSYQFSIYTHLAYEASLIFSVSAIFRIIRLVNLVRRRFNRYQFSTHTYTHTHTPIILESNDWRIVLLFFSCSLLRLLPEGILGFLVVVIEPLFINALCCTKLYRIT